MRLGELLEKRGQLTRELLMRALRNQKVLGGRLGTCLLEIEAISEEQLCGALAEQYAMPCATPEELRGIPDDVLALLPAKVARRCHAIAFHASATQVKVALVDARNLGFQDEISFVVGKRIRWHVATELRMLEALEKHYGEECPSRLAKLLDKMNRSRFLWAREAGGAAGAAPRQTGDQLQWDSQIAGVAPAPPAPGAAAASPASPPSGTGSDSPSSVSVELPHFQHQTLELPTFDAPPAAKAVRADVPASPPPAPAAKAVKTTRRAAPAAPAAAVAPPPPPAPPPGPPAVPASVAPALPEQPSRRSVEEAEQRLLQPRERDDVARALHDYAAGLGGRTTLFVVRKEEVAAWLWSGEGIDAPRLAALRLSLKLPSLFDGLRERDAIFRGTPLPLPSHAALTSCYTKPPLAKDLLVLPVKVKERLVAALLLEPRPGAAAELSAGDLADLQRVIAKAEIAFELCIMQAKLRKA